MHSLNDKMKLFYEGYKKASQQNEFSWYSSIQLGLTQFKPMLLIQINRFVNLSPGGDVSGIFAPEASAVCSPPQISVSRTNQPTQIR